MRRHRHHSRTPRRGYRHKATQTRKGRTRRIHKYGSSRGGIRL